MNKSPLSSSQNLAPFQINRRRFLQNVAVAGLPVWFLERQLAQAASPARRPGPNDRPGIALIGCGGMGRGDANNASRFGDLLAVCDVDEKRAEAAVQQFTKDGKSPTRYRDFRKVLERADIQIIIQGTPDHWHTLVNLAAVNAKKDVYAEKPLTHSIDEGRRLVAAVRKQGIVLQTGTQQRSDHKFRLACELVRNGRIGTLKQVSVFVPAGLRAGPFSPQIAPPELDWDFWLGPAPRVDYLKERCHANFRWWFDYAGGPVTDWGAHHNDIARWAIGLDGPSNVEARALVEPIPGGYTTPPEFEATLTWPNGVRQIVRTTTDDSPYGQILRREGQRNGVKFEGTSGWIWVNRADLNASDESIIDTPLPESPLRLPVSKDHMENFFACVRSRRDPVSPVQAGHRSASVGHLIVIALRTGMKLTFDPVKEVFIGTNAKAGNTHLAREMRKPYTYKMAG
jgi:predicted dehydrogenase